ncbi:retrovirus-related pol polyprotein from transposon TNT 1-94, partial [Tanacetum coccineum]
LARGVHFGTGRAFWHDRAVWHEPEQFSSELNNISLPYLYSLCVRAVCAEVIYRIQRIDIGAEDTTEGRKQNRLRSKSWKIGEIKYMQNITCWNYNQKGHFHNLCSKLVTSRDKEVNMIAGESDDALVCCIENTIEDRIMNSGASFHATYYKEELERFKLRSGKASETSNERLLKVVWWYHVGTTVEACKWLRIGMSMLAFKDNVLDVRKVDIYFCKPGSLEKQKNLSFIMSVKTRKLQSRSCGRIVMLKMVPKIPLQFGVAKRLGRTFRAESTGIRPRIPEEEWRGKDTSLTHLKVFGCDSFVKVKYVCREAMKCTFIHSGSDEMQYRFQDTKSHQVIRSRDITFMDSIHGARFATDSSSLTNLIHKSQVVLVDIPENLAENDSIVAEHGLSSEITQSLDGSSDTSKGSENSGSFEDSGRSDEEDSEDGSFFEEEASRLHMYEYPPESLGLQLWMFNVKEEHNGRKRYKARLVVKGFQQKRGLHEPSYVGALNDTSTQHKSEGFQLAGQEENLECILKEILYGLIQAPRLRYLKFNSFMQKDKAPTWQNSTSLSDSWNEEPCNDVHQVGDEREVKVLRSFNWPPSELITEDGVLLERGVIYRTEVNVLKGRSCPFIFEAREGVIKEKDIDFICVISFFFTPFNWYHEKGKENRVPDLDVLPTEKRDIMISTEHRT